MYMYVLYISKMIRQNYVGLCPKHCKCLVYQAKLRRVYVSDIANAAAKSVRVKVTAMSHLQTSSNLAGLYASHESKVY